MKKTVTLATLVLTLTLLSSCSKTSETKTSSSSVKTSETSKTEKSVPSSFNKVVDAGKATVDNLSETYSEIYSNIEVSSEAPETLVFTYTYKNKVDPTASKEELLKNLATGTKPDFDKNIKEYPNFKERFIYLNNDKKELYNILVTEQDVNSAAKETTSTESE